MKRSHHLIWRLMLSGVALASGPAIGAEAPCPGTPLDSTLQPLTTDAPVSLCRHLGEVVLVVNTASQCGFTSQYEGLETLYQRFRKRGFTVIGVPSDQFGGQEYADDEKIAAFCKLNFGVSFPMYTRSRVTGDDAIALYQALLAATGQTPQWNFHKYLIGRDGRVLGEWPSRISPHDAQLVSAIDAALDD